MYKKRHHFVPNAYLKFFCDEEGKLRVYLKDKPSTVIHQSPDNTGFHKYYYSQPLPEGGKDHNTLEDFFSELEAKWPPIVERFLKQENVNDSLQDIFNFIALQRVRVPASRDACEKIMAEMVKANTRILDAKGMLAPKPEGFEDILNRMEVAIDPHQSIHAMAWMLQGAAEVCEQIGISTLHNTTDIPFLTSDNPVIWFDPSVPEAQMRPYGLLPKGPIVLLFPVAPNLIIYGGSSMRERFVSEGLVYSKLSNRKFVKTINRHICRFAYRTVFAQRTGQEALIRKHADVSPVARTQTGPGEIVEYLVCDWVFGVREQKPKWVEYGSVSGKE